MCESKCKVILFAGGIYLLHKDAIFAKSQQAIAFEKKKKLFLSNKIEPFSGMESLLKVNKQ